MLICTLPLLERCRIPCLLYIPFNHLLFLLFLNNVLFITWIFFLLLICKNWHVCFYFCIKSTSDDSRNKGNYERHKDIVRKHSQNFYCFPLPFFSSLPLLPLGPSTSYNYSEQNTVSTWACIYTATTDLLSGPNRIKADRTLVTRNQNLYFFYFFFI